MEFISIAGLTDRSRPSALMFWSPKNYLKEFRQAYHGTLILAGGYLKANGQAALDADEADLIAVGKPFLANPDLVERLRNNWPLNEPDRATFYTAGTQGYIDYPICRKEDAGQIRVPPVRQRSRQLRQEMSDLQKSGVL